jgi:hypothetical protein
MSNKHKPRPTETALGGASGSEYRPLAHKGGITLVFGLLVASGAMCPKCGFGTRVTSKRWARCKQCGERVERVKMSDIKIVRGAPQGMPNNEMRDRPVAGASQPEGSTNEG